MRRRISRVALAGVLLSCAGAAEKPRPVRDPTRTTELALFMKSRVNPSFSKISFLLFHEDDSPAEVDPAALPASAGELSRAAERLSKWTELPGETEESRLVFTEYAAALKTDAVKLVDALRVGQKDKAKALFESLHRKCDACHHFFRYDQGSVIDTRTPDGARP